MKARRHAAARIARRPCVAVLGAGILGSCTALELARRNVPVVLFDQAAAPMTGASRWNEGKIHLGHLYSASGSCATARRILPGGLVFKPALESLLERRLDPWITTRDDIYLFHRDSVVSAETSMAYMRQVHDLVLDHPDACSYPGQLRSTPPVRLTQAEIDGIADPQSITAGMRVPERSICTRSVADAVSERLAGDPKVEMLMQRRVEAARRIDGKGKDTWQVDCGGEVFGPFDAVVNALWAGRPSVDAATLGASDAEPSHRYRVSAFVESDAAVDHPPAVVAVGPFGDVKNYGAGRYYVSWYADGLLAAGTGAAPPPVPDLDGAGRRAIAAGIASSIGKVLPGTAEIFRRASKTQIEGGWVYAKGGGLLSDPHATLHRRDRIGFDPGGSYVSVDTGKYSVAPLLARDICRMLGTSI